MAQPKSWWDASSTTPPPPEDGQDANLEFRPIEPKKQLTVDDKELLTRRIHLLGTGSIGCLVAHSLAILPHPPTISWLMHRPQVWGEFQKIRRRLRLENKGTEIVDEQQGFDVDVREERGGRIFWHHIPAPDATDKAPETEILDSGEVFIYTLIVTTKAARTIEALQSVKHRVNSKTTILFMQNGMGQLDLLNKQVFTDPETRPTYMVGVVSHGCYMRGPFFVKHAGFGAVSLGVYRDPDKFPAPPKGTVPSPLELSESDRKAMYPTDAELYSNMSSRYLLRTLTRSPVLACSAYPYLDLLQLQLEKLASNCLVNPLTALFDVENGVTLEHEAIIRIVRLLIAEISHVMRNLPELDGIPNVKRRFSPGRLEALFRGIAEKTAANSSSMREDIRHVRDTEIHWINGYIVKRGEEVGVKCVMNYMIMQMIKAKLDILSGAKSIPSNLTDQIASTEDGQVVLEDVEGRAASKGFVPFLS